MKGCCGHVKLAQVLGRLGKYSLRSWLGNSEQANHSRLRKLEIEGGWRAPGWEMPCCYSWASVGATSSLSPAGLQVERGLLPPAAQGALSVCACLWMEAEEGLAGKVPLLTTLFEDLHAGGQVQPPMMACQRACSCPP